MCLKWERKLYDIIFELAEMSRNSMFTKYGESGRDHPINGLWGVILKTTRLLGSIVHLTHFRLHLHLHLHQPSMVQ